MPDRRLMRRQQREKELELNGFRLVDGVISAEIRTEEETIGSLCEDPAAPCGRSIPAYGGQSLVFYLSPS